jgi:hypothetical protein
LTATVSAPTLSPFLRIHLFSQSLTTTRDSHVTLTITSPSRLLCQLSAFTTCMEQYSTNSKDFLTYVVHFPSGKTLAQKSPGQTLKRGAIPNAERPVPAFHSSTEIPCRESQSHSLSSPATFHIHIISSHRRVQHLRPFTIGLRLALITTHLYHLQHEPARLTSPLFVAQPLTFLSRSLNIFQKLRHIFSTKTEPRSTFRLPFFPGT